MAKSLRSKVKRSYRAKKRDDGVYAATEAARLNRLNAKLKSVITGDDMDEDTPAPGDSDMTAGNDGAQKPISTHGPRGSRREQWRLSKGMIVRPASRGMNRQGGVAARRHAGRSKRRR